MTGQVEAGEEAPAGASPGFSTLEAVVAIGILGLCILPLMDFQMTVSEGAARLASRNAALEAEMRAEAWLRALPPEAIASGESRIGGLDLAWQELAAETPRLALSEQGAPGRFELRLVRLSYEVRQEGNVLTAGEIDRLVWRPIAPFLER